jgi:phage regulator Rha-like protein
MIATVRPRVVVRAPLPWQTISLTIKIDPMAKSTHTASIARTIVILRGQKVLLDADLALLYGVPTKRLNEQVRRNANRFPADFMFQLTDHEVIALRSQIATSKPRRGGRRYLPYAFTEHGAIMAATILNTPRAIEVSVYVVRAFVQLREVLATHKQLAERLDVLESKIERKLATHDRALADIISAIRELMAPPDPEKRPIGFVTPKQR